MVYQGYLALGDVEILNATRAHAYASRFLPRLELDGCYTAENFRKAVQFGGAGGGVTYPDAFYPGTAYPSGNEGTAPTEYTDPVTDFAPWYVPGREASGRFYGLYPIDVLGMDKSTHRSAVQELVDHGSVVSPGRHAGREIMVTAIALAADDEALEEGMAWLRSTLDTEHCGGQDDCAGRMLEFFSYNPGHEDPDIASQRATDAARIMYRVEALEGPLPSAFGIKHGAAAKIEFTLIAGVPWWFTRTASVGSLTGSTTDQIAHEPLPPDLDGFDELVVDPVYTNVVRPPRPPLIQPAGVTPPENWYHYSLQVEPEFTGRWGTGMARLRVRAGASDRRMVRIRMYSNPQGFDPDQFAGSDWDGEFLISYIPAGNELVIDSALQVATVGTADNVSPAGHLLYGSDGRPFNWPSLNCNNPYVIHVDVPVQLDDAEVVVEMATRE